MEQTDGTSTGKHRSRRRAGGTVVREKRREKEGNEGNERKGGIKGKEDGGDKKRRGVKGKRQGM